MKTITVFFGYGSAKIKNSKNYNGYYTENYTEKYTENYTGNNTGNYTEKYTASEKFVWVLFSEKMFVAVA